MPIYCGDWRCRCRQFLGLYTFLVLQQGERAQVELRKMQLEAQQEARFDLTLGLALLPSAEPSDRIISVELTAKNVGSTNAILKFGTPALINYPASFGSSGEERWEPVAALTFLGANSKPLTGVFGELSATKLRRFSFKVASAGIYVAVANASVSDAVPPRGYFAESNHLVVKGRLSQPRCARKLVGPLSQRPWAASVSRLSANCSAPLISVSGCTMAEQ